MTWIFCALESVVFFFFIHIHFNKTSFTEEILTPWGLGLWTDPSYGTEVTGSHCCTCRICNALGAAQMIAFCVRKPCRTINVFLCVRETCCFHVQGDWIRFRWVLKWLARGQVAFRTVTREEVVALNAVWYKEKLKTEEHQLAITVWPPNLVHPEKLNKPHLQ